MMNEFMNKKMNLKITNRMLKIILKKPFFRWKNQFVQQKLFQLDKISLQNMSYCASIMVSNPLKRQSSNAAICKIAF